MVALGVDDRFSDILMSKPCFDWNTICKSVLVLMLAAEGRTEGSRSGADGDGNFQAQMSRTAAVDYE